MNDKNTIKNSQKARHQAGIVPLFSYSIIPGDDAEWLVSLEEMKEWLDDCVNRHRRGDWGEVDKKTLAKNAEAYAANNGTVTSMFDTEKRMVFPARIRLTTNLYRTDSKTKDEK